MNCKSSATDINNITQKRYQLSELVHRRGELTAQFEANTFFWESAMNMNN